MPRVSVTVPHNLSQDEAVNRIKGLPASLQSEFAGKVQDVKSTWTGNKAVFSLVYKQNAFLKANVTGDITVGPSQAIINVDLPAIAAPFVGTLEQATRDRAASLLS